MEKQIYRQILCLLEEELLPAMGCTEPIAIAYAALATSSTAETVL